MASTSAKPFPNESGSEHSLREQTGRVMTEVRELGNVAATATTDKLGTAKERSREMFEHGKESSLKVKGNLEDYVREHPLRSLACAAGVGVALALYLRR
jgi:ElaB/YqjD/DUF883 family membrane-anchored ribosome-binding protein